MSSSPPPATTRATPRAREARRSTPCASTAPWAHTHTVTAQVSDVDGISIGSDVRIAGRLVGQITAVKAQGDHSSVTFHIDDSEWPLPVDTSASVRLATLLGQKYIQLVPGSDKT